MVAMAARRAVVMSTGPEETVGTPVPWCRGEKTKNATVATTTISAIDTRSSRRRKRGDESLALIEADLSNVTIP